MTGPRDAIDGEHELGPEAALAGKRFPAGGGEPVVAAAPFAGALDPAAADQAAILEPAEDGVERSDPEGQAAVGATLDALADVVAVPGAVLEQGEDEQLRAAFLQLAAEHAVKQCTFLRYIRQGRSLAIPARSARLASTATRP
jgi:hypothetical protein